MVDRRRKDNSRFQSRNHKAAEGSTLFPSEDRTDFEPTFKQLWPKQQEKPQLKSNHLQHFEANFAATGDLELICLPHWIVPKLRFNKANSAQQKP